MNRPYVLLQYRAPDPLDEERRVREAWARSERMAVIRRRIEEIRWELKNWNNRVLQHAETIRIAQRTEVAMFDDAPEVMTPKEVSKRLGIHERTFYGLANRGEIPAIKVGKSWRVVKSTLIEWLTANQRNKGEGDAVKN